MEKEEIVIENKKIIDQIKKYAPKLGSLFDLHISLKEYSHLLYNFNPPAEHLKRQELVKTKIKNKLEKLFGNDAIKKIKVNLDGKLAFNIADHHQVLNHPFLVSANAISSAGKFSQKNKQDAIIVISSGDVPPNNYFSRNGFTFNGKRVPIFSNSERESTSYYIPKRDFNFIEKMKIADKWKEFNVEEKSFLQAEYDKIKAYDYSNCRDYNDQITVIVKNLWPSLFEEKMRENLPELLYITQEELVTECLIELLEEDNIISKCLFDKEFREKVLKNFRGIVVTWNEEEEKGTHFFWRKYPDRSQSLRLYIKGDKLVPKDERFESLSVPLEKKAIIELLKKREIYPSLFTIFGVLNFYAGVKPLVGYGSVIYLNLMKEAWSKTLRESNLNGEADLVETVELNGLVAGLALFFKRNNDKLKTLYAFDIIHNGGIRNEYLKTIFKMKFSDFLSVATPDMYDYVSQKYIPKKEKIKVNAGIDDLAEIIFSWL